MGFCGDLKAAMSLDQSPLATSSGVGSSGCAMLQRRQDTIRYGCDVECDNDGVHKGLVFTVIFCGLYHPPIVLHLFGFPYLRVGGQAFGDCCRGQSSSGG